MRWKLAAVLAALSFSFEVSSPRPADACGVKLTIKNPGQRKAQARSSNPSDILLVGKPPRRLQRDLAAAGHRVEVADDPNAAKRDSYAVVVADASLEKPARSRFANSVVVVRSDNIPDDVRLVERQVTRRPVAVDERRTAVAARAERQPIAVGPAREERKVISTAAPTETVPEPAPAAPRVAATEPKPPVQPKPEPKAAPKPEPVKPDVPKSEPAPTPSDTAAPAPTPAPKVAKAPRAAQNPGDLFFGYGKAQLASTAALDRAVAWLQQDTSINVVIEGHADPSGNPDANMALAQSRAEWVRDYLVKAGIDASRLEVVSFGDTKLKYGASDGRNRRVVLVTK